MRSSQQCRRALPLSVRAMLSSRSPIFQPYNDTSEDRYPDIFRPLSDGLNTLDILSFGCSTGQELISLRSYFPMSEITGIDASRANVADARRRTSKDPAITVRRAVSTTGERTGSYDLIFAMAVFRHGALTTSRPATCRPFMQFDLFDDAIADMVRCLRPGGVLVVEHSNFRVSDTTAARHLTCVLSRPLTAVDARSPLYGPDDALVPDRGEDAELAFRLLAGADALPGDPDRHSVVDGT